LRKVQKIIELLTWMFAATPASTLDPMAEDGNRKVALLEDATL
jgi:hypothetical protein